MQREIQPGRTALAVCIALAIDTGNAAAEEGRDNTLRLDAITVTAPRVETPLSEVPGAVGVVGEEAVQRARPTLGLDESLNAVPGVSTQNRYNFAQDLRVSIRGAGARAPFGIRGIRILVDGIPATLPDGQASVDAVDLGAVQRIEVLRGPSSALYGNASGGVIRMETEDGPPVPFAEARHVTGSHGLNKTTLKGGGQSGPANYFGAFSRLTLDGYRDHASTESNKFNGKFSHLLNGGGEVTAVLGAVNSPRAQDPGALTEAQVEADREQAAPNNLQYDAGESVQEQRAGVLYDKPLGAHHNLRLRGYTVRRDFENSLPFTGGGIVVFDRLFGGAGVLHTYDKPLGRFENRLLTGLDLERQQDDRQRYDNQNGERGALVFDQLETVTNLGVFLQNETALTDRVRLTLGARYDRVSFDVDDRNLSDGIDDSGERTLSEVSPRVGLSYRLSAAFIPYANVSRAFETPTTTELASCTGGGLSDSVDPQTAINYEVGANGQATESLRYSLAVYTIDGAEEIVPIGCPGQPGRDFYVNAGRTRRNGAELGLNVALGRDVDWTVAYTWSDFRFDDFATGGDSFDGNTIPGVPEHAAYTQVEYRGPGGFYTAVEAQYAGAFYADNANNVETDAYTVANWRLGWTWFVDGWTLNAFGGVNNLTDEAYNDNVRINAFGGRYFEPAPGRNYYGGARVSYEFGY